MTDPMLIEADGGAAHFPPEPPKPDNKLPDKVVRLMANNKAYAPFFDLCRITNGMYIRDRK